MEFPRGKALLYPPISEASVVIDTIFLANARGIQNISTRVGYV
jgi:hypothetical protein